MTAITPAGATVPGVTHHQADVNTTQPHDVSAGTSGSPVLLVHGWPETRWAFRKVIPLLAATQQVFALDLRGFGDFGTADGSYDAAISAEDMHCLVEHLGTGPVRVLRQDPSGSPGFRALVVEIRGPLAGTQAGPQDGVPPPSRPEPLLEPLSGGEIRVLRYLPTNLTGPEIAAELYLSYNTVRTHLRHLYAKLGTHRRAEAVARARALGLLAPSPRRGRTARAG
jgi:DNA-binding CsgD family transcriptional regulator